LVDAVEYKLMKEGVVPIADPDMPETADERVVKVSGRVGP
jgi:hypothetical protein